MVVERLTAQCENVVNHLRDTTSGKVSVARMELYFKLDTHNRWVGGCLSFEIYLYTQVSSVRMGRTT